HIGPRADPDRGAPSSADIVAGQRARGDVGARREHPPNQYAALRISDIDAEFVDRAGIVLGPSPRPRKTAAHRLRGAEDKTPATGHVAGQRADLHTALGVRGPVAGKNADRQAEPADGYGDFREHAHLSPFAAASSRATAGTLPLAARRQEKP